MLISHKNFNSEIKVAKLLPAERDLSIENNPTSFMCFLICIKFHFLMVMSVAIKSLELLSEIYVMKYFFKEFLGS